MDAHGAERSAQASGRQRVSTGKQPRSGPARRGGKRGVPRVARSPVRGERTSEATAWVRVAASADAAVRFWNRFFDLRQGTGPSGAVLSEDQVGRILAIVRAVSWVESKHGTDTSAPENHPSRDPMQCGADAYWRELTKQSGKGGRYIGGPNAAQLSPDPKNPGNYWGSELADAVPRDPRFPAAARLSVLGDAKAGHDDPGFNPTMSYYWGVLYLIHRCNTEPAVPGGRTYSCGDLGRERLVLGSVKYNGGGDPGGEAGYRRKIEAALALFGGLSNPAAGPAVRRSRSAHPGSRRR